MATYHLTVKVGSKGKGASAALHADYIERDGRYSDRPDFVTGWSENMPEWAGTPREFWKTADENERANAAVYREIEIALPRELADDGQQVLVDSWCRQTFGDRHAYTVAIHCPAASIEGGKQPHAHIMFSERRHDPQQSSDLYFSRKGARKERAWQQKETLGKLRESWADAVNMAYEQAHRPERVDHRSFVAQGIDRAPEPHLGPHLAQGPAADHVQGIRQGRSRLAEIEAEIAEIKKAQASAAAHTVSLSGIKPPVAQPPTAAVQSNTPSPQQPVVAPDHYLRQLEQIGVLAREYRQAPEGSAAEASAAQRINEVCKQAGHQQIEVLEPTGIVRLDGQPLILLIDAERRKLRNQQTQEVKRGR